jgi:hypothetical protein
MTVPFQLALGNNTPRLSSTVQGTVTMSGAQYLAISGGAAGQVLTTDGAGHLFFAAVTATGTDAPSDTYAYGRVNAAWAKVLPLTGGSLTGLLTLSADPSLPLQAATKQYVDSHIPAPQATVVDGTSITGTGLAAAPLKVATIDGGLY